MRRRFSHGWSGAGEPLGTNVAVLAGVPRIWKAAAMLTGGHLLAHQGGWDEALLVVVPVGLFASLVWAARRRERHEADGPGRT